MSRNRMRAILRITWLLLSLNLHCICSETVTTPKPQSTPKPVEINNPASTTAASTTGSATNDKVTPLTAKTPTAGTGASTPAPAPATPAPTTAVPAPTAPATIAPAPASASASAAATTQLPRDQIQPSTASNNFKESASTNASSTSESTSSTKPTTPTQAPSTKPTAEQNPSKSTVTTAKNTETSGTTKTAAVSSSSSTLTNSGTPTVATPTTRPRLASTTVAKSASTHQAKADPKTTSATQTGTSTSSTTTIPTGSSTRAGSSTRSKIITTPFYQNELHYNSDSKREFQTKDEKNLEELCKRLTSDWENVTCAVFWRKENNKVWIDSVEISGKVKTSIVSQHYEDITKKPTDNKTLIAILASCGALLIMIVILAVCASHHRKPYNENQQHLTEELHTVENGYHDNPTLEVMEVQPEMQEKKVALNGEFNDSWIVPIDNLLKEDIPDEEDTHL